MLFHSLHRSALTSQLTRLWWSSQRLRKLVKSHKIHTVLYCTSPQYRFRTTSFHFICSKTLVDRCDEVMTPGKGGENLIRWYFNPTSGQCERFTYHGTLGNANNYMTEDDCLDDCLNSESYYGYNTTEPEYYGTGAF